MQTPLTFTLGHELLLFTFTIAGYDKQKFIELPSDAIMKFIMDAVDERLWKFKGAHSMNRGKSRLIFQWFFYSIV